MDQLSDLELEIAAFHQPAIDSARKMILLAGLTYPLLPVLLFAMLAQLVGARIFATSAFLVAFGIGCAALGAHVALWWWAKRSPLAATVTALVVFIGYMALVSVYGTGGNRLVTLIGLVILVRGVLASYRAHKLRAGAMAAPLSIEG